MRRLIGFLLTAILATTLPAGALPLPVLAVFQPTPSNIPANTGFTPTTLGATNKAWWDADDPAGSPGVVGTWTDRTASIATVAVGSAQPTVSATSFVGLSGKRSAGVTCDGVANALVSVLFAALPVGTATSNVWMSTAYTSAGGAVVPFAYGSTAATTIRRFTLGSAGGWAISDLSSTLANAAPKSTFKDGTPELVTGQWSGTGTTFVGLYNGAPFVPASLTTAAFNTTSTRLRICANNSTSAGGFYPGVVRHVVVNGAETVTQTYQMAGWAAWDGGYYVRLPYNHPFRFRQP